MKVKKLTLLAMAISALSFNIYAYAGPSSALDPYSYIQAPTKEEREAAIAKKHKKFKTNKRIALKQKSTSYLGHSAEHSEKSSTVQLQTERPVSVVVGKSKSTNETEKEVASAQEGDGFLDGIKQSTAGLKKSTKAVSNGMFSGTKVVGSKIAQTFVSAGDKVKSGTTACGEKIADSTKKLGDGLKSSGEHVKESGSTVSSGFKTAGSKMWQGTQAAGGAIAAFPKAIGKSAQLNPFHKKNNSSTIAQKSDQVDQEDQKEAKDKQETEKSLAANSENSSKEESKTNLAKNVNPGKRSLAVLSFGKFTKKTNKEASIKSTDKTEISSEQNNELANAETVKSTSENESKTKKKIAIIPKVKVSAAGISKLNLFAKKNKNNNSTFSASSEVEKVEKVERTAATESAVPQ